eukprot:TRINITY_DN27177_c0_g1_i1.p1 TRINITY_DN27177_c0_g1~~TRINITY_DN27177_c0_g1_i1.p1  ORF type:complete len:703 (+),score=98.06 TRINITY_DN27177_c0_g1_i1:173-2281(+)
MEDSPGPELDAAAKKIMRRARSEPMPGIPTLLGSPTPGSRSESSASVRGWRSASKSALDKGLRTRMSSSLNVEEGPTPTLPFRRQRLSWSETDLSVTEADDPAEDAAAASSRGCAPAAALKKSRSLGPSTFQDIAIYQDSGRWLISENSRFLRCWGIVVLSATAFLAFVTPYEAALLDLELDAFFVVNRILDVVFIIDMTLQFFIIINVQTHDGLVTVRNQTKIAIHYLRGWFLIDLVGAVPFDVIAYLMQYDSMMARMRSLRLIRLSRLLKLLRLLRASKLVTQWRTRVSMSFSSQTILACFCSLMVASHWMACLWALFGKYSVDMGEWCWIDHLESEKHALPMKSPWDIYMTAAHISVTSIKATHGNEMPQNHGEYVLGWVCQWLGGLVWTYTIGQFCGVFSNLNPDRTRFQRTMDDLNRMMDQHGVHRDLRYRLRDFFFRARELHTQRAYTGLLNQMSPLLQAEVTRNTNRRWLMNVWYLRGCSDEFVARVSQRMTASIFCPQEQLGHGVPQLVIVLSGLVGRSGRVLRKGAVFGEDFILSNPKLRDNATSVAITFAEILAIDQASFLELAQTAAQRDRAELRWGVVRLVVMRGIIRLADQLHNDRAARNRLLDGQGLTCTPSPSAVSCFTTGASESNLRDEGASCSSSAFLAQVRELVTWRQQGLLSEREFLRCKERLLNEPLALQSRSSTGDGRSQL